MSEESNRRSVPQDVRIFLRDRIESFEQLEALLLMNSRREQSWTADEVAAHLAIPVTAAEAALEHLRRKDLLNQGVAAGIVSFTCKTDPDHLQIVDRLSQAYKDSRVEVISLMSANTIERIRTQALHGFADAFILRRKKKDG